MIRSFNDNWLFTSNDGADWESVTLPHDAQMTLARSKDAAGGSAVGFFPGGSFRYRKKFMLTKEEAAGHITFHFGGVYKNAVVRINGQEAGGAAYGYIPFSVAGDGLVREGENEIEVSCSNAAQPDSRWYSGAGIYRPVTIQLQGQQRILPGTVRVRTESFDSAGQKAVIRVDAATEPAQAAAGLRISAVLDKGESITAERTGTGTFVIPEAKCWSAETPTLYRLSISLPGEDGEEADHAELLFGIRLIEKRQDGIYVNGTRILLRGGCIHADNGILGAREYKEAAYRRIYLLKQYGYNAIRSAHNPISEELLEACDRLGMYVMDETWDMWYRKKNKYDYACYFQEHYKEDIRAMVEKDYNHPSVILYSIGNEVSEPAQARGVALGKEMTALFHQLDPGRLVTGGFNLMIIKQSAGGKGIYDEEGGRKENGNEKKMGGMNSTMFNMIASMVGPGMNKAANGRKADEITAPILDAVDVAGYNYASGRYAKEGKLHPGRLIVGSETFPQDIAKNWAMVEKYPWLQGDFMWTAWDYLGEAGIGTWSVSPDAKGFDKPYPWLMADAGALDLTGAPTGEAFMAASVWTGKTFLAVRPVNEDPKKLIRSVWRGTNAIPSWSFAKCEGKPAVVEIYTGAPAAELYLNGKKIGRKRVKNHVASFKLAYAPGELKAVALTQDGKQWKEPVPVVPAAPGFTESFGYPGTDTTVLQSAGADLRIGIHPETTWTDAVLKPGSVVYVDVDIEDGKGILESNRDRKIRLQAEGAQLLGFGSAQPRTEERFDAGEYTTWRGRALAILRLPDVKTTPAAGAAGTATTAKTATTANVILRAEDITNDGRKLATTQTVIAL